MNKIDKNQLLLKKKEAYSLFKEFSFSKAIDLLNFIIVEDKKDYMCFFLLGTSYLHIKNLDLSEKNLKISIKLNNEYYDSIHNLGVVKQLKENFTEAINLFIKALELKPNSLGSLTQLAEVYEKIKSFDKAKQYYEASLEIDAKNLKANQGMARICIKFGYHKQGLQYLQKSTGLIRFNDKNFEIIT
jgi:tetratricopeptide (TPR) repeat protein